MTTKLENTNKHKPV